MQQRCCTKKIDTLGGIGLKLHTILLSLAVVCGALCIGGFSAAAADAGDTPPLATGSTPLTQVRATGTPATWEKTIGGEWQYFDEDGNAVSGETTIDGKVYLFAPDGVLRTGWQTVDGARFYYNAETHERQWGWIHIGDQIYYADRWDGKYTGKQVGLVDLDGNDSGKDAVYLLDSHGALQTGYFTYEDGARYYADASGVIVTGDVQIGDTWYQFGDDGKQVTGWVTIQGGRYYFDSDTGMCRQGLCTIDDSIYYITNTGVQTGMQTAGDETYYFNAEGAMETGLQTIGDNLYFFQEDGTLFRDDSITIDGTEYTADADGVLTKKILTPETDAAGRTYVMGQARATVEQMQAYIRSVNPNVAQSVLDMIPYYLSEGEAEGVRGDIAFAQACLETGNFAFRGSAVTLDQNNFCGLGVTQNGMKGNSFATPQLGIRAQIQHLKAYADTAPLNQAQIDPRFAYVIRGCAPYVDWLGIQENPQRRGWAAGKNYGSAILRILAAILKQ